MATLIDRETSKLMISRLQKELDALFQEQEENKSKGALRRLKAQYGIKVPTRSARHPNDPWTPDHMSLSNSNPYGVRPTSNSFDPNTPLVSQGEIGAVRRDATMADLKDMSGSLMQLSPVISNLIGGLRKEDQLKPKDYFNPYRNQIKGLMSNRRVNIQPQLDEILSAQRIGARNVANVARSSGDYLGNITALSNRAMGARSTAMSNKMNADLGLMGEEANMLYNLGQGEASTNFSIADYNAANLANRRNIGRTGLSQLSQWSQLKELQGNQMSRDKERLLALEDMFSSIAPFMKSLQGINIGN